MTPERIAELQEMLYEIEAYALDNSPLHDINDAVSIVKELLNEVARPRSIQIRIKALIKFHHDKRFNHHHVCNDEYEECRLLEALGEPT